MDLSSPNTLIYSHNISKKAKQYTLYHIYFRYSVNSY